MEAEQQATAENGAVEPEPIERKNLFQILREWPLSRKIAAISVLVISIVLFAVLIIQSRIADHQLLYANLTETDAASVVNWLKGQRVPYTLKNGGKNIWIPADRIYETRLDLASNGLPSGGGVGYEVFDNQSFALTDYVQKVNYTRALQGELARTITSLDPVETTRVHLAIPEKRLFKNQQKNATASVIVTLGKGRSLDGSQVKGIIHLVAGSVTGLEPDNVKVIDSNGLVLETDEPSDMEKMLSVDMLAFQREVESRLEMRAQALLDKTMGQDMAMVRVTATLDFAKVEKTEELFDSEEPVIRSEQINTESSSGGQSTGGIPGVQSNLQGNAAGTSNAAPGSSRNSRTTNYEISKTISKIVNPVGTITKLSVSVLVSDKTGKDEASGEKTVIPRTAEELDSLKEMVSAALGLVPRRGDQISIVSMPFIDPQPAEVDQTTITAQAIYHYIPLVKIALVPLGALLIYFLLIRPIIKTMRGELKEHYKTVEEMERERLAASQPEPEVRDDLRHLSPDDQMAALRKNVINTPTQTAFIVKNWINEG